MLDSQTVSSEYALIPVLIAYYVFRVKARLAAVTQILPLGATSVIQIRPASLNSKAFT